MIKKNLLTFFVTWSDNKFNQDVLGKRICYSEILYSVQCTVQYPRVKREWLNWTLFLTVMSIIYVYEERPSRRFAQSLQQLNSCSSYTLLSQLYFTHSKRMFPNSGRKRVYALQRTNTENSKQIIPEKELRGHSPDFHIPVSVSDLYINSHDRSASSAAGNMWTDPGNT